MLGWRISTEGALELRSWEDGAVVFNSVSGETCRVSHLAAELISLLDGVSGYTLAQLYRAVSAILPDDMSEEEGCVLIHEALSRMEAQNLVAPVDI